MIDPTTGLASCHYKTLQFNAHFYIVVYSRSCDVLDHVPILPV
jgi:hypothetical protein